MKRIFTVLIVILIISLASLGTHLTSGSNEAEPTPEISDYFDLLRYAKKAVRQHPDHLPGQFDKIVGERDPEKLIEFIRTRFDVIPPWEGWNMATNTRVWGTHGTLRAGAGTPLEIAELLELGLSKMGYETQLVSMKAPENLRDLKNTPFDESVFPETNLKPFAKIDGKALPEVSPIDRNFAFWQDVFDAIPEDSWKKPRPFGSPSRLPSVVITQIKSGGEGEAEHVLSRQLVNLWSNDTALYLDETYSRLSPHKKQNVVKLSLLMKTDKHKWHQMPKLLEATFAQDMLAGGRINIKFSPVADNIETLLSAKPANIINFLPSITLDGGSPHMDETQRTFTGSVFSNRGEIVDVSDDGDVLHFGDHVLQSGGDPKHVATLTIRNIDTSRYPWLSLSFDALDQQGNIVEALPNTAFKVNLDETAAPLQLTANTRTTPKIIFLIDGSTSVAPEYRAAELGHVITRMADAIQTDFPGAKFRVMTDSGLAISKQWETDTAALGRKASSIGLTRNNMWKSLIKAQAFDPDVIIFFTDGNDIEFYEGGKSLPYEALPESIKNDLSTVVPTFTLGGERPPEYLLGAPFTDIPNITGGKAFNIVDHESAINAICSELDNILGNYRAWIKAPERPAATSLSVLLKINNALDEKEVAIPPVRQRHAIPSITGLYLQIERPGGRPSIHRLAGGAFKADHQAEDAANARLGLFGQYTLLAEAGAPSLSQILDDTISARLSWENVIKATDEKDKLAAFAKGVTLPRTAFAYSAPLDPTYDSGLRYWLDAEQRVKRDGQESIIKRTDIVPLWLFSPEAEGLNRYKKNYWASSQINNFEQVLHNSSNFECLSSPLTYTRGIYLEPERKQQLLMITAGYDGLHYIIPDTGDLDCAIGINPYSGAALFINSYGGAGATVEEVKATFDEINNILDAAGLVGSQIDAWATLEQAKMKHLREATISIITMEAPDLTALYTELACDAVNKAAGPYINSGIRRLGGRALEADWQIFDASNKIAKALGLNGVNTNLPIEGCP